MASPDLFVICGTCGSKVSPYVTECPYCGTRLRKRAPDLKKQRKLEEKEERRAEKRRERLRAQYEGGGSSGGAWLSTPGKPAATISLITIAAAASILAVSGLPHVSPWLYGHLFLDSALSNQPWALIGSPFLQGSFGYGLVCLVVFGLFGAGIERRFGPVAVVAVWLVCGALGVAAEALIAPMPVTYGAYAVAAGTLIAWTSVVAANEDLRDLDTLGLAAVAFVICMLPLATPAASVWSLVGGIVGGLICGGVLSRITPRG